MTEWKIVPVDPTEAMLDAGFEWSGFDDTCPDVYDAMIATSPKASEDEVLVSKVANAIALARQAYCIDTDAARAVLKALET